MYHRPTGPRSIGGVLDDSIQLFKASFTRAVIPALLTSAVVIVELLVEMMSGAALGTPGGLGGLMGAGAAMAAAPGSAVLSLLGSLLNVVLYGAIVLIIIGVARGDPPKFGAAFAAAWRRFGAMLGASILVGLIGALGFVLACIPVFLNLSGLPTGAAFPQIIARLMPQILESLVLLLPVIYVLSRLMLYSVPLLGESQSATESIATSWRLIGGNWWRTTTIVFVLGLIVYVLTLIVIAIAGTIAAFIVGSRTASPQAAVIAGAIVGIATAITKVISSPLIAAMFVVIYQDLQLRKGGGDLEARLGALPNS
jgi:hypothetical protein